MGRKILLAVVCWLAISKADADASVASAKIDDTVAEANVPRLYRSIGVGVYATASPYASFSFQVPAFATSRQIAHNGPIKQESVIVENKQGFLKDSYGNKFVDSPQSLPYRTAFPQQYVQLQELPAHLAQPLVAAAPSIEYKSLSPHFFGSPTFKIQAVQAASPSTANHYAINQPYNYGSIRASAPGQQHHPTNNKAVYLNNPDQFQNFKNVGKSQRLEAIPNPYKPRDQGPIASSGTTNKEKNAAIKDAPKSSVPLLDLHLLEPLTFANPLVPQVQHFLPRISSVTYHKLPQLNVNEVKTKMKEIMIQKTKSYESADLEGTPKVNSLIKQQQIPHPQNEDAREELEPQRDVPNDDSYDINSPNYKELYNEKFVNYNKETQSEPIHYSYEMKSEKEPISYNYVRTTNEPYQEQDKDVKQNPKHNNNQDAKHLIYQFSSEENDDDKPSYHNLPSGSSEDSREVQGEDKAPIRHKQQNQDKSYAKETRHHDRPEHRKEELHNKPEKIVDKKEDNQRNSDKTLQQSYNSPQKHGKVETLTVENPNAHFQPILQEHEEDIRVLPTPKKYAPIKVDPNQHIQPHNRGSQELDDSPRDQPYTREKAQYAPEQHVEERAKHVIIKEETPQIADNREVNDESPQQDGKSEEEFESGYNNAAYGFPAYGSTSKDAEKEIYDPQPYAPARYHSDFDGEDSPFQRYVADTDEFPKSTRSNYKDARDKTKDSYYLDYAVSKPESMLARFKQKEDYYKMYMHRRPQYMNEDDEADKKTQKESAKYTSAPNIEYHASAQKPKQYFAKYKVAPRPQAYGYDYAKEAPKDNSAHATGPYQRLKTHTQFVEPQFQYGFEPSALPRLLDSELAAMASNYSPESEKPLMRKKVYKENWYIKKTSTNGKKAAS